LDVVHQLQAPPASDVTLHTQGRNLKPIPIKRYTLNPDSDSATPENVRPHGSLPAQTEVLGARSMDDGWDQRHCLPSRHGC
jgi:hypothetical protein